MTPQEKDDFLHTACEALCTLIVGALIIGALLLWGCGAEQHCDHEKVEAFVSECLQSTNASADQCLGTAKSMYCAGKLP